MNENVFTARLNRTASRYSPDAIKARHNSRKRTTIQSLLEESKLGPDRGFTQDECMTLLKQVIHLNRGDLIGQVNQFFKAVDIPSASGKGNRKGRKVSNATLEKYYNTVTQMIDELREMNIKPANLNEMSYKHVAIIIKHWESKSLSSSTITNRYSILKRFYRMIGKENVPPIREILVDPKVATRSQTATKSLDWNANGVDANEVLKMIDIADPRVGTTLKLCRYFGMRLKEAVSFNPLENVFDSIILINKGAKGGRSRAVPIETAIQRKVLHEAALRVNARTGYLGQSRSLESNLNHVYKVLNDFGITKAQSGVTVHGLRHSYLNEIYERITQEKSPINGGSPVPKELDRDARLEVSRRAGHSRIQIASAYLGTHKHLSRLQKTKVHQTLDSIEKNNSVRCEFDELQKLAGCFECSIELSITGPSALGQSLPAGAFVTFGLAMNKNTDALLDESIDLAYQAYRFCAVLEPKLTEAMGQPCAVLTMDRLPADTPTLTLKFS